MSHEDPRITLRLSLSDSMPDEYAPIRLPDTADLEIEGAGPELIDQLKVDFRVELRPGHHDLPVTRREPLRVDVAEGCTARGWLCAKRPAGQPDAPAEVTGGELVFEPPVELSNVAPTLARLPTLFTDRAMTEVRDRAERSSAGRAAVSLLGDALRRARNTIETVLEEHPDTRRTVERLVDRARAGADEIGHIRLAHVTFRPGRHGELELRFSGENRPFSQVPIPFAEVRLSRLILPSPRLSLAGLLSGDPLETARLHWDKIPQRELATALAGALSEASATVALEAETPEIELETELADRTLVTAAVSPPGPVGVKARTRLTSKGARFRLEIKDLEVELAGGRLAGWGKLGVDVRDCDEHEGAVRRLVDAAFERRAPEEVDLTWSGRLRSKRKLGRLELGIAHRHPRLAGGLSARLCVSGAKLDLRAGEELSAKLAGEVHLEPSSLLEDGPARFAPTGDGSFAASCRWSEAEGGSVEAEGEGTFALAVDSRVEEFPELSIHEGDLHAGAAGKLAFEARAALEEVGTPRARLDLSGSAARIDVERARLTVDEVDAELPAGARLSLSAAEVWLGVDGLGRTRLDFGWDLNGRSPVLTRGGVSVEPLVDALLHLEGTLNISQSGGLRVTGPRRGMYDAHYLNALLNPQEELERLLELLSDHEAQDRVADTAKLIAPDAAGLVDGLLEVARRAEAALDALEVETIGDFLPAETLARFFSRLLNEDDSLTERTYPLVKRVTDGRGLDLTATKRLLTDVLGDHDYQFEVDRGLRLAKLLMSPAEPLAPRRPVELAPLAERPEHLERFEGVPDAATIYDIARRRGPLDPEASERIVRVAPYLRLEQLEHLLRRRSGRFVPADRARLDYVRQLKRRANLVAAGHGGLTYFPQALAIAIFLGDAVVVDRGERRRLSNRPPLADQLVDGVLGPADVAVLLHAGLTPLLQGRTVQLNQRLLLDAILARPPHFLLQTFAELGGASPRILASVLLALLEIDQDRLREPIDLVDEISKRLDVRLPRRAEYMAGGRWAKYSYFEALTRAAELVLDRVEPYLALKERLQVRRATIDSSPAIPRSLSRTETAAKKAVSKADELASKLAWPDPPARARRSATTAYKRAFERCARLVERAPRAFAMPWLKDFWGRNYEALIVLSVVRNVQEDVDRVRPWLAARVGRWDFDHEQELLDAVVDALYFEAEDRERLKADPLVRLLIDPPEAPLDFTIVSAMGVITEGEKGAELKDAYARLRERRGVRTIRANTKTFRSLEHNAAAIVRAARRAKTPWGYIGYSQGCANGLRAEARLLGGPPEEQALAVRLVCRNLLFSAANGSAHGTCGNIKFLRAMNQADRFLSHYQAFFSDRAIGLALRVVRLALGSQPWVLSMRGAQSLAHEGVEALFRDGQFRAEAPTSICRGVVREETLPEGLEWLSNLLSAQLESDLHDTQVEISESVGHPVWVKNDQTEILREVDMGCLLQATHHWSPLTYEIKMLTTERDRDLAVYDAPKDRHVFPWVDVNARFGVIRPRG